jgi:hypothetical protein
MVKSPVGLGPESDSAGKAQKHCTNKLRTRPLVREAAAQYHIRKCQTFKKSGHGPQMNARQQDRPADWPSVETTSWGESHSERCYYWTYVFTHPTLAYTAVEIWEYESEMRGHY